MAATLTDERFTGLGIFERKYDGIRLLAFRKGNSVRLLSRNHLPQSYPAVAGAIGGLAVDQVILDGEVDWGDGNVNYHVFDILWLNGRDLMPLALIERRAILHHLGLRRPLRPVPEISGDKPWERACLEGWEGVIAKRRDSPYEHRRSPHWLKMKCEASQELVVGGFTDPCRCSYVLDGPSRFGRLYARCKAYKWNPEYSEPKWNATKRSTSADAGKHGGAAWRPAGKGSSTLLTAPSPKTPLPDFWARSYKI